MRIIAGLCRGRKLKTLEGIHTRPTLDRVKEPLFSILGGNIEDAIVLDLFAGSGALGLEALSRGAKECVFVDNSRQAISVIQENIKLTGFFNVSKVLNMDFKKAIKHILDYKFNLIFIDPPYAQKIYIEALKEIRPIVTKDTIIVVETDYKDDIEQKLQGFEKYDERKYGRVVLSFFKLEL